MVSKRAAQDLYKVMKQYVAPELLPAMLVDLSHVPGNRSYQDTIAEVKKLWNLDFIASQQGKTEP